MYPSNLYQEAIYIDYATKSDILKIYEHNHNHKISMFGLFIAAWA